MKKSRIVSFAALFLVLIQGSSAFSQQTTTELYQKAEEYKKNQQNLKAIREYSLVVKKFPESEYAPAAQYTIAQIYFYRLKKHRRAKEEYEKVVRKYPNSKWASDAVVKIKKCQERIEQTQSPIGAKERKVERATLTKLQQRVVDIVGKVKNVSKQNPKILVLISIGIVGLLLGYWLWRLKIGKGESEHSALSFMSSGGEARIDPSKPFSRLSDFQRGGVKLKLGKEEISPFSRRAFGIGPGKPFSFDGVTIRVHACSSLESYRERRQWCNESNKGKDSFTCCFCHETVNLLPPELDSHRMDTCPNCGREIALYVFENNPEYNKTLQLRGGAPDFAPVNSGVIWTVVPREHPEFRLFVKDVPGEVVSHTKKAEEKQEKTVEIFIYPLVFLVPILWWLLLIPAFRKRRVPLSKARKQGKFTSWIVIYSLITVYIVTNAMNPYGGMGLLFVSPFFVISWILLLEFRSKNLKAIRKAEETNRTGKNVVN